MSRYEVVVGNIGTVYGGRSGLKAYRSYRVYVKKSKEGYSRAAGEDVTLFKDGEIVQEHIGTLPLDQAIQADREALDLFRNSGDEFGDPEELTRALAVMILDKHLRMFLESNDPQALKQARKALGLGEGF